MPFKFGYNYSVQRKFLQIIQQIIIITRIFDSILTYIKLKIHIPVYFPNQICCQEQQMGNYQDLWEMLGSRTHLSKSLEI